MCYDGGVYAPMTFVDSVQTWMFQCNSNFQLFVRCGFSSLRITSNAYRRLGVANGAFHCVGTFGKLWVSD